MLLFHSYVIQYTVQMSITIIHKILIFVINDHVCYIINIFWNLIFCAHFNFQRALAHTRKV